MKKESFSALRQYRRLFQKMHGTILFARILPTVILSFACILLLFLALVFGLNLPHILRSLLEASLIALFSLASCYLFWEKVIERPNAGAGKTLVLCLLSETILPTAALILAAIFLYWPLVFFSLYPLCFGLSLYFGKCGQKYRQALLWVQFALLCLTIVLSVLFFSLSLRPIGGNFNLIFLVLLCASLYIVYGIRRIYLLCDNDLFAAGETAGEEWEKLPEERIDDPVVPSSEESFVPEYMIIPDEDEPAQELTAECLSAQEPSEEAETSPERAEAEAAAE